MPVRLFDIGQHKARQSAAGVPPVGDILTGDRYFYGQLLASDGSLTAPGVAYEDDDTVGFCRVSGQFAFLATYGAPNYSAPGLLSTSQYKLLSNANDTMSLLPSAADTLDIGASDAKFRNAKFDGTLDGGFVISNTGDIDAAGGLRRGFWMGLDDATTSAYFGRNGTSQGNEQTCLLMARAGSIVELGVFHDDTSGSAEDAYKIKVEKSTDGGDTFAVIANCELDLDYAVSAESAVTTFAKDTHAFGAGDILRVKVELSTGLGPLESWWTAMIGVEF